MMEYFRVLRRSASRVLDAFPYGRSALGLLFVWAISAVVIALSRTNARAEPAPDLILTTFVTGHAEAYRRVLPQFERLHHVRVRIEVVSSEALQGRLQAAMMTGSKVPDMVELQDGSMGFFTSGPLNDVGFVDLTERVQRDQLKSLVIENRFSAWQSRGHVFALPHDVHPVLLAYRRDLVEQLGIDVNRLTTWGAFFDMGRKVSRDLDGDGVIDRFALDLPLEPWGLKVLLLQRGQGTFDASGELTLDTEQAADAIELYVRALEGRDRIAYPCGFGSSLYKCMLDGLALFYLTPDWRAGAYEREAPSLSGKLALMPLPAWQEGGRQTSVYGGTGMAITKASKRPDLAYELAKFLYYDKQTVAERYREMRILPPVPAIWSEPVFFEPNEFFSNQATGRIFARFAEQVPPNYVTGYTPLTDSKLYSAFQDASAFYKRNGPDGLHEMIRSRLKSYSAEVHAIMDRNAFAKIPAAVEVGR